MSEERKALDAFRHLLESTSHERNTENLEFLLDRLVGAEAANVLRRCAVPHEFDLALLQRLSGWNAADAADCYEQFAELSLIHSSISLSATRAVGHARN